MVDRQAHYEAHFNNGDGLGVNELDAQLAVSEDLSIGLSTVIC